MIEQLRTRLQKVQSFLYLMFHDRALYDSLVSKNESFSDYESQAINLSFFGMPFSSLLLQKLGLSPEFFKSQARCDTSPIFVGDILNHDVFTDQCNFCLLKENKFTATHDVKPYMRDQYYLFRNNSLSKLFQQVTTTSLSSQIFPTHENIQHVDTDSSSQYAFNPIDRLRQKITTHKESVVVIINLKKLQVFIK